MIRNLFAGIGALFVAYVWLDAAYEKIGDWRPMYEAPHDGTIVEVRPQHFFGWVPWVDRYAYLYGLDGCACAGRWVKVSDPAFGIIESDLGRYRWRPYEVELEHYKFGPPIVTGRSYDNMYRTPRPPLPWVPEGARPDAR